MNEPAPVSPFKSGLNALIKSKTFWINTIAAILACIPVITEWITANGIEAIALLAGLNYAGKLLTAFLAFLQGKKTSNVEGESDDGNQTPDQSSIKSGNITDSSKLLMLILFIGTALCLPSCGGYRASFSQNGTTVSLAVCDYKR